MTGKRDWRSLVSQVRTRSDAIRLACEAEVSAPKLGNVHPQARFIDCDHRDFLRAAATIAPILGQPITQAGFGQRVLQAVQATQGVCQANVNLGIVLLIAPLALADQPADLEGIMKQLTQQDAEDVFTAIRLAKPGGVTSAQVDTSSDLLRSQLKMDLLTAMRLAEHRDDIAKQYATSFRDFFESVLTVVADAIEQVPDLPQAIVLAQVRLMSQRHDTLIERKCGAEIAREAKQRAKRCLEQWTPAARAELDEWLRADGNRRNPGTIADLIAASLYWLLWTQRASC